MSRKSESVAGRSLFKKVPTSSETKIERKKTNGRFYFDWGHFFEIGLLRKFLNRFFDQFSTEFKLNFVLNRSEKYVRKLLQSFSPIGLIFSMFMDDFRFL